MKTFKEFLAEAKSSKKIEALVKTLKVLAYGDMLIIKVLDALGNDTNPDKKHLHAALKKAGVKDKDISVATTAALKESDEFLKEAKIDVSDLQKELKKINFSGVVDSSGGLSMKTVVYRANTKIATISETGAVRMAVKNAEYQKQLKKLIAGLKH